ncbi:MAG: DUF4845 domain-containing protein, partial [Gammaproteobacteria bacterium]|nr:DUF4845 domain-containing protein [Gammaproteobacteria bacterium]
PRAVVAPRCQNCNVSGIAQDRLNAMMGGRQEMIAKRFQRGMSIWVLMYILGSLGVFGLVGLKLFPAYLESFKVDKALEGLAQDPRLKDMSKNEIKASLVKRLDIDEVRRITERNFNDYVTIDTKGNRVVITVDYSADVSLAGNVSIVAHFHKQVSR